MDGLTTNGILIMKPKKDTSGSISEHTGWNEVSINGRLYGLRETRSAQSHGIPVSSCLLHNKLSQIYTIPVVIYLHICA